MFEAIKTLKLKPGLENLENQTTTLEDVPEKSQVPAPPPVRFGATKIELTPDPNESEIKILEIPNKLNTNDYVVFIYGPINGAAKYYAELVMLLETLTESSHVTIYIASPGGSLYTGAMISSAIKTSHAMVTLIACGVVASAAALIWSHGKIRQVKDNAVILFHMSSHVDWGNSVKIKIDAENTVRYVKEICIDPMVEQGLLTLEEAETIINKRRDVLIDATTMALRLEKLNDQSV